MLNRPGQRASQPRPPATRRRPAVPTATDAAFPRTSERVTPDLGRLEDSLGYVLRRAQLAVFKSFQNAFRGTDITPAQISVMIIIERNPGLTHTQVADALIKANKSFDLLIVPNLDHGLTQEPYVIRRSWDFFVRNLRGEEPPAGYELRKPDPTP